MLILFSRAMLTKPKAVTFTVSILAAVAFAAPVQAEDWIIGEAQAAIQPALSEPQYMFDIGPQPLRSALSAYGIATGLELFYDSRLAAGRNSPGVSGKLTSEDALEALLTGTGLTPVKTSHDVITLVLHQMALPQVSTLENKSPSLQLSTLHVNIPDLSIDDQMLFAATVRYAIQGALRSEREIHRKNYSADIMVWVTPAGNVQRAELLESTGNPRIDTTITRIVRNVVIGQPPPRGLRQPVHVDILASGAK
jgi:TonB family protein